MFLVRENRIKSRFKSKLKRIYVNTLIPYFEYRNKSGQIIRPENKCVYL